MRWGTAAALVVVLAAIPACNDNGGSGGGGSAPASTTSPTSTTSSTLGLGDEDDIAVVAAAGDIACAPTDEGIGSAHVCQHGATADLIARIDPDAVLTLGDLQYPKGEYEYFVAAYDKTWGRFRDKTIPSPGNHEYATRGGAGYYRYWGERAGRADRGFHSTMVGGWKVIAINSNCSAVACGAGSEQERWLRQELAGSPRCALAFWHHPRYSSGLHGGNTNLEAIWVALAEGGADLVLAGHDHHYERFAPNRGVRSFVVGTGGKSLYPVVRAEPGSEVHSDANYGVLELRLGDGAYEWRFHATGGAAFTDTGRDSCR